MYIHRLRFSEYLVLDGTANCYGAKLFFYILIAPKQFVKKSNQIDTKLHNSFTKDLNKKT